MYSKYRYGRDPHGARRWCVEGPYDRLVGGGRVVDSGL